MASMTPAEWVSWARKRAGLNKTALAGLLGIDHSGVVRLEAGAYAPRLSTLERVATATGASLVLIVRPGEPAYVELLDEVSAT